MSKINLEFLDPARFGGMLGKREAMVSSADGELSSGEYSINKLAKRLHPSRQLLNVSRIERHGERCKSYILTPDADRECTECAYFSAGQYVSLKIEIDGKSYTRPYSISSSPKDALNGEYRITVKAVPGGKVSNHIIDNLKVGDSVECSAPTGNFVYEELRDAEHIVGIAGGSGVTPFMSLAHAIADGDESCSLTLIYGCRKESEIIFKDELDRLCEKCDKLKVVYVLSDEQKENYKYGYISSEIIAKELSKNGSSVFVCGNSAFYAFEKAEIAKLGIKKKYVRYELQGEPFTSKECNAEIKLTVVMKGEKLQCEGMSSDTVLRILEKNGIAPPNRCRSGECGFCRSHLISGNVRIDPENDRRRMADLMHGYIHPCVTYPEGDLEIEIFVP